MNQEASVDSSVHQSSPMYYSIRGVIALYICAYVSAYVAIAISENILASPLALLFIILFVTADRPRVFALSRWRPSVFHVVLGVGVGYLLFECAVWLKMLLSPYSIAKIRPTDYPFVLAAATFLMPVTEEIFFRGVLQSSLQQKVRPLFAIALTAVLAALGHVNFWIALPSQIGLGSLFALTRRSLPASIACHITANSFVVLNNVGFVITA